MAQTIELSKRAFASTWLLLLGFHGVCAAFLASASYVCWYLQAPLMDYYTSLFVGSGDRLYVVYGAFLGMMSCLHGLELLRMMMASIQYGELRLRRAWRAPQWPLKWALSLACLGGRFARVSPVSQQLPKASRKLQQATTCILELLSLQSHHYYTYFTIRKLWQVALQVYQAYRASNLIARLWLVDWFVAATFLNCCSTPSISLFFRWRAWRAKRDVAKPVRNVTCLTTDIMLDVMGAVVFPTVVLLPYLQAYEPALHSFSLERLYDDSWFPSFAKEGEMLSPISIIDLLAKASPHWAMYRNAIKVSNSLHRCRIMPSPSLIDEFQSSPQLPVITQAKANSTRIYLVRLGNCVCVIAGIAVLAMHLDARIKLGNSTVHGCSQPTLPWLVPKCACLLYEINCNVHGIESATEELLLAVYAPSVLMLSFVHCPRFIMPRALRTFPNLASIGLFNLTLVDWNASATFAPEQASLSTIEFALVNLSGIPEALLQPSLPSALIDIEFSHTNLTSLPANLHEFWPSMEVLYLEYSEIREVPETLLHMDLFDVSLAGNHLENVSRLADGRPGAAYLSLCFNPLQSLPETIPSTSLFSSLAFLNLHHTQVRRMPEWINTIPADSVLAVGTPFCEDESETRAADFSVVCSGDNDRQNGSFPFAFVMGNLDPAL